MDLAAGHIAMLSEMGNKKDLKIYNFGTGIAYSVMEVVQKFEKHIGIKIPYKFTKRREGDVAVSYCNPKKALKELGWKAKHNFDDAMIDIKKTF